MQIERVIRDIRKFRDSKRRTCTHWLTAEPYERFKAYAALSGISASRLLDALICEFMNEVDGLSEAGKAHLGSDDG